jgi:thiol:disulfide interchange protein DsbD
VVEVRAVPEFAAVRPGAPFRVAIELRIPPGWHIGWFNPGAGGLATTITWRTPKGIEVRETAWPYPETDDAGAEISHVYRGTVVIFSSFGATRDLSAPLHLSAELEWGLCQEQCVRQRRTVDVSVAIARGAPRPSGPWRQVALAQRALPVRLPSDQVVARVAGDSATVILTALANGPAAESWATFFPVEPGRASVVAQLHAVAGGVALTLPASVVTGTAPGRIAGVLVAAHAPGAPPPVRPLAIDAQAIR